MMSSPSTNQYSKLHETLTRMPPNIVESSKPDDDYPPSPSRPGVGGGGGIVRHRATLSQLPSSDRDAMPSSSTTAAVRARRIRKLPLASSMHSQSTQSLTSPPMTTTAVAPLTPPPSAVATTAVRNASNDEKSFARDFFGSSKRKLRSSFFSKRNLKVNDDIHDNDDDDNSDHSHSDSTDSLRDPLNLPPVILKRREDGRMGGGTRSNPPPATLTQTESEKTFDFEYTNLERRMYPRAAREEERRRWNEDEQQEEQMQQQQDRPQPQQQSYQEDTPISLETLQEHVMKRRGQEGSTDYRQGGATSSLPVAHVENATVSWATTSAPSATITQRQQQQQQQQQPRWQEQAYDDASWRRDLMRTKNAVDETLAELQKFRPQDDIRQYPREDVYEGRRVEGQGMPHLLDGGHPDERVRRRQQLGQQQNYPGSLRNLATFRPPTTSTIAWEESSLMDDILRATEARGRNGELLSRNEVLAELGILPSNAREYSDGDGRGRQFPRQQQQQQWQHELPQWQEPQKQPPQRREPPRRQEQHFRQQQNEPQHARRTSKLQSIPDDQTWIQEVLFSSNKQGYSADAIKALLESVPRECKEDDPIPSSLQQENETYFQDRETWLEDVQRTSNVCPVVLQELMEARSGSGSGSKSAHQTYTDMSRHNIYPTKPQHHSTVIQDTRGPVPTDDMLAESLISHEGSESTGSRLVGDDVLVVSRKNRENRSDDIPLDILEAMGISDGSLVKDRGGGKKGVGKSEIASPQRSSADDEITAEDVLAQLGADVDYESIPDDVLAALGISRSQLRRVDSIDVQNTALKSGNDASYTSTKASSVKNRDVGRSSRERPFYLHKSYAEDDVSWVEDVPHHSNQVNTSTAREFAGSSNTDSLTSSSLRELATDERGPIPEADMLEEAFSKSSGRESLAGSLRSLKHAVEKEAYIGNDRLEEGNYQKSETCPHKPPPEDDSVCGTIIEMKPSLGFMRHNHTRYGTYDHGNDHGDTSQNDLELEVMKKRSEVLASIELCRSKLNRNRNEGQQHD
eukprot:CCRYP_010166-RA/>CCRYP_010166-RA protein AED:0.04 eAED:0.04 QI:0/-1/0/1/-1/1/1/0/1027